MDATCDEEDVYFCTFCGASLPSLKELMQHNRKAHKISDNNSVNESDDMDESETPDETGELDESEIKQIVSTVYAESKNKTKKRRSPMASGEKVQCELCNRQFSSVAKLERHAQMHLGIRVKDCKCDLCGKLFSHSGNLKTHMRSHTGDRPYKCKECGRCFSVSSHLKRHMLLHSGEKPFSCMFCGKQFTQSGNLKAHIRTHSNSLDTRRRRANKERKPDENKKPKGADDGDNEAERQAEDCKTPVDDGPDTSTISADENDGDETVKSETDVDVGQTTPKNPCLYCGKKFSSPSNLTVHLRIHSGDRPFQCQLCNMMFTVSSHLRRHLLIHSGEKPFECMQCGKHFRQSGNLSIHMKVHSKTPTKECTICGMNFTFSRRLAEHMQQMHPDDAPKHKCEECGQHFVKANNLAAHRRKHTEDVKQFHCPKCDENFANMQDLTTHLSEHDIAEHPVVICAECGETFSDASELATHMETEHTAHEETPSEKPHRCMYCGQRFVRASELLTHIAMCALSLRHVKQESSLKTGVDDPDVGSDNCLEKELEEILHSRPESPLPATATEDSGCNTQLSTQDAENVAVSKELEHEGEEGDDN